MLSFRRAGIHRRLFSTIVGPGGLDKIIIANRGEIACRVIDTCKLLNVRTVAVYSTQDANSRHVQLADEAYHIGPSEAKDSYLRGDKVIEAALKSGAKALHPGYGFLSENSDFAKLCEESGVTFMGPPPRRSKTWGAKATPRR
mmetsp:Transcript_16572/g.34190  ORF Transcript_16572/g.34190 Transcript_16572/m.34190 type:complete len:143 (-) Transcript_16572:1620-2048(-)